MIFHGQPSQDLRYTPLASTPKEVHGEDPSTGFRQAQPTSSGQVSLAKLSAC